MDDRRATRGVPERWLLPPPPRDATQARRWEALPFQARRALARVRPERLDELSGEDRSLVVALADARLATSWRALAVAPAVGWLVLMTFWGFGRSTYPDDVRAWLLIGAALGAVAWMVVAIRVAARLRRARQLVALGAHASDGPSADAQPSHDRAPHDP